MGRYPSGNSVPVGSFREISEELFANRPHRRPARFLPLALPSGRKSATFVIIGPSTSILAWIIHENAQFSLAPFAHRKFCSLGNTVCIPLVRKISCEQSVHRDNRTFHE